MTTFPDLDQFQSDATQDSLTLPIGGKTYEFRSVLPFGRALQLEKIRAEGRRMLAEQQAADAEGREPNLEPSPEFLKQFEDVDQREFYLELIGDDMQQVLIADRVPYETVLHIGATLYSWHLAGETAALRVWTRGKLEDSDVRPPAGSPGKSGGPKTSPSGSTTTKRRASRPRQSSGRTTSTAGASSKRTSTASTRSTSRTRKS